MMPWSLPRPATLVLVLAGCASAPVPVQPTAPPPVDPVGTFDFSTQLEGGLVNGTLVVTRSEAGFGGSLTSTATESMPVTTVAVEGQKMTVTAATPDGPVVMVLDFKGDDFGGTWSYGTMSGTHTGKRRKP